MEYAKQGSYFSKVIYYQTIDDHETSEERVRVFTDLLHAVSFIFGGRGKKGARLMGELKPLLFRYPRLIHHRFGRHLKVPISTYVMIKTIILPIAFLVH